jgi:anaerobic selenocysteine-containing dehydrogenase
LPFGGGLTLAKLRRAEHGMDLGPLEPCLPARLHTPGRRIELAPELFITDLGRLRRRLGTPPAATAGNGELLLIGRRDVRSNNSWMHNFPRLMRGRDRCTLLMHPRDADRLGLAEESRVAVVSRTGRVTVPLEISDRVMPGVVSLPHGWGHHREGIRLATASSHPGASLNDLTDECQVDLLCGTAVLNGVAVRVEPADTMPS